MSQSPNPLNFNDLLQLITDGSPVDAGTVNPPLEQLDARSRYLYQLIQAAASGSTIFARQQTVISTAVVGAPVWFNPVTQQFEGAIAAVALDQASGALITAPTAQVWGVVYQKINATLADILLFGLANLNITAALESGQTLAAGSYYLSRVTAGALTASLTPLSVPILRTDGNGNVFVNAQWQSLVGAHSHAHFSLVPMPAGTHRNPGVGNRHTITNPNSHTEGWLPANDAIFGGKAPVGAKFGYNISVNAALAAAWPPLPAQNAVLLQNGVQVTSGYGGLVVFDNNGIWWMSDCYNDVPFPPGDITDFIDTSISIQVSESYEDCGFDNAMRLDLYFTQFQFLTDSTVVTSLTSGDPRVQIVCQNNPGTAASVGPLEILLNLGFLTDNVDPGGWLAIKGFTPANQTFHFGSIVTGLYTSSPNITLNGDEADTVEIGGNEVTVYRGNVQLAFQSSIEQELEPNLVRLDGALEEYLDNVMYLGFPVGAQSDIRVRFQVPKTLSLPSPQFTLVLRLMGLAPGTLPTLTVTMRRVPDPGDTVANLPLTDSSVTINTNGTLADADQYIEVESTPFAIAAGDDIFLSISRGASDGYTGEVGVLRMAGLITTA